MINQSSSSASPPIIQTSSSSTSSHHHYQHENIPRVASSSSSCDLNRMNSSESNLDDILSSSLSSTGSIKEHRSMRQSLSIQQQQYYNQSSDYTSNSLLFEPKTLFFPLPNKYKTKFSLYLFNDSSTDFIAFTIKNPNTKYFEISSEAYFPSLNSNSSSSSSSSCSCNNNCYGCSNKDPHDLIRKTNIPKITFTHKMEVKFSYPSDDNINVKFGDNILLLTPKKLNFHSLIRPDLSINVKYSTLQNYKKLYSLNELYLNHLMNIIEKDEIQEEIQSYYCPSCLTEFAKSEAMFNKMKCQFCFSCPSCQCNLNLVTRNLQTFLSCPYCYYDTLDINLKTNDSFNQLFEIVKENDNRLQSDFNLQLRKYADHVKKLNSNSNSNQQYRKFSIVLDSYVTVTTNSNSSSNNSNNNRIGNSNTSNYGNGIEPLTHSSNESLDSYLKKSDQRVQYMTSSEYSYNNLISFESKLQNNNNNTFNSNNSNNNNNDISMLYPQRKTLCIKKIKKYGEEIIVKRDSKNHSTNFDINYNAIKFLPKFSILNVPVLNVNRESDIYLLITNPNEECRLYLNLESFDNNVKLNLPKKTIVLKENNGLESYSADVQQLGIEDEKLRELDHEIEHIIERRNNQLKIRIGVLPFESNVKFKIRVKLSGLSLSAAFSSSPNSVTSPNNNSSSAITNSNSNINNNSNNNSSTNATNNNGLTVSSSLTNSMMESIALNSPKKKEMYEKQENKQVEYLVHFQLPSAVYTEDDLNEHQESSTPKVDWIKVY
ncbi:predicted protein [Naegleria gruberi]|uniref:Dynactin subunit 4 n=1 Tax=Naegleria gruberi TaxID=5762 RepID=D2VC14_NAEGR|nr:uncharacterized protein NAEGRDRAFT_66410 [Naegleria gruberi]EFC45578.1 predicted protein [Naegleria gruberi]|eukprot:XP_002678322.1 predicted protein [Naegleria gruberi strain NEG-M]